MVSEPDVSTTRKKTKAILSSMKKAELVLSPRSGLPETGCGDVVSMSIPSRTSGSSLRTTLIVIGVVMVLVGYGYAGYVMYHRLHSMEKEIRRAREQLHNAPATTTSSATEDDNQDTENDDGAVQGGEDEGEAGGEHSVVHDSGNVESSLDTPVNVFDLNTTNYNNTREESKSVPISLSDRFEELQDHLIPAKGSVTTDSVSQTSLPVSLPSPPPPPTTPPVPTSAPVKIPGKRGRPRKNVVIDSLPTIQDVEPVGVPVDDPTDVE